MFEKLFSNQIFFGLLVLKKAIHASGFETPSIYRAIIQNLLKLPTFHLHIIICGEKASQMIGLIFKMACSF